MKAESAGEKPVSESDLGNIVGRYPCGTGDAGDQIAPGVHVFSCITHDGRLSCGSGGSVNPYDFFFRLGE
ncbi:hypothetical protein SDC9_201905 [bioreactor metagenome]|uniref:Uncharacterized protein n=1 Tax=bioreactor metagenome TaxID=1076179 RepID=A0A645IS64_9ZZZZ